MERGVLSQPTLDMRKNEFSDIVNIYRKRSLSTPNRRLGDDHHHNQRAQTYNTDQNEEVVYIIKKRAISKKKLPRTRK